MLPGAKFPNPYEGNWQIMHPEKKLIGRAVTVQFMPFRPDLMEVTEADAKARGLGRAAMRYYGPGGPGARPLLLAPEDPSHVELRR